MHNPRISVAMCTFNGALFIEAQVRSILDQSTPVHQLVVADDGSIDSTLEIVHRLMSESSSTVELIILDEPLREGVTANFERAIRVTDGEVIFLCDQDDVWHPDKVSTGLQALNHNDALFHHTDARLINSEGSPLRYSLFDALGINQQLLSQIKHEGAFPFYLRRNLATGATACFRRDLLHHALPFPPEWVHDEWLAIIAAARGGLSVTGEATVDYRQHGSNQIGVAERTVRNRVRRVFLPRGDRTLRLARRSEILADHLRSFAMNPDFISQAESKVRFEFGRSRLPQGRLARLPGIVRLWSVGGYAIYASQGNADVLRDLLQPAS